MAIPERPSDDPDLEKPMLKEDVDLVIVGGQSVPSCCLLALGDVFQQLNVPVTNEWFTDGNAAGPTGLLSALLARQLGLSVCILDAKHGPLQVGGADAITARTQQFLEVASNPKSQETKTLGILDGLLSRGVKCNTSTTYVDGEFTSRQSKWWNGIEHTFYNNLLMIGQPFIERHLASYIDVPTHYSEPALSFSETASPPGVSIRTEKRTANAKYCLVADGARSFMRNELGIGWTGTKPNMIWAVLDCWIETTFPIAREIVTLQADGESRVAWIPRERGMQRFYVLLEGEITQEKTEASIRRHMAPHSVEFTHIEWFSKFEIKERVAEKFLYPTPAGPFILAGDAAHVHSVNGGQGMNTGLSDAFNLIWRLYILLKYNQSSSEHPQLPPHSAESILKSYDIERRATANHVIDVAAKLVRSTTAEAKEYVGLIEKNSSFITGMGVQYSDLDSPLVRESEQGVWKAGHRAPDLWLHDKKTQDSVRLYQKMIYGRYMLILVQSTRVIKVIRPGFATIVRLDSLRSMGVGVGTEKKPDKDEGKQFFDKGAFGCALVKKGEEYAVLVRPDCYVEFVGEVDEGITYIAERLPGLLCVES